MVAKNVSGKTKEKESLWQHRSLGWVIVDVVVLDDDTVSVISADLHLVLSHTESFYDASLLGKGMCV